MFVCVCVLHSRLFLAVRDHCPAALLKVCAHWVFGRSVLRLPNLTSHTDVACAYLRWSILATWPPHFHSNCEPLTRFPSCWFCALLQHSSLLLHTTCSILRSMFPSLKPEGVKLMACVTKRWLRVTAMYVGKYLRVGTTVCVNLHYIIYHCLKKILQIAARLCVRCYC